MTVDAVTDDLDVVSRVIAARRTSLLVDRDRPVPSELIDHLCDLAAWAPCHKRTWPWCFASLTGEARRRLGEAAAEAIERAGADPAKVDKTRTKYLRSPVVMVVGARHGDTAVRTLENRDAVSAAIENLLLGATAAGLASHWSSCPEGAEGAVRAVAGFDEAVTIVAIIYLGWPSQPAPPPERPRAEVTHLT
jgi:nitroreductase